MKNVWTLLEKLSRHKADQLTAEIAKTNRNLERLVHQKHSLTSALGGYQISSNSNFSAALLRNQLLFVKKLKQSIEIVDQTIQKATQDQKDLIESWRKEKLKGDGYEKMKLLNQERKISEKNKKEQLLIEETFTAIRSATPTGQNNSDPNN